MVSTRGFNTIVIHADLEFLKMLEDYQHETGQVSLYPSFIVAKYILEHERDRFIRLFGEEKYNQELGKWSRTDVQIRDQNLRLREERQRRAELRLQREELVVKYAHAREKILVLRAEMRELHTEFKEGEKRWQWLMQNGGMRAENALKALLTDKYPDENVLKSHTGPRILGSDKIITSIEEWKNEIERNKKILERPNALAKRGEEIDKRIEEIREEISKLSTI